MFIVGVIAVNINVNKIVEERLIEETKLAAGLVDSTEDFLLLDKYKLDNDFRITVLDFQGNVLYESDTNSPMENHSDREEIKNALAGTPKVVHRYSYTFKNDMTYYAIITDFGDEQVLFRLALRSNQVKSYYNVSIPLLVIVALVGCVVSFFVAKIMSENTSKKFVEIKDSLNSLNSGEYKVLNVDSSDQDLYGIIQEISDLNAKLFLHIFNEEQEHKKLDAVLSNISQGIVALNSNNEVVFVNDSAQKISNDVGSITEDTVY